MVLSPTSGNTEGLSLSMGQETDTLTTTLNTLVLLLVVMKFLYLFNAIGTVYLDRFYFDLAHISKVQSMNTVIEYNIFQKYELFCI